MIPDATTSRHAPKKSVWIGISGLTEEALLRQLDAAEAKVSALKEELCARQAASSPIDATSR